MTESELRCIKCDDAVTLETSHASGRNVLRRVCGDCSGTDRWLQRCRKTKDKKGGGTEKEREARVNAEKVAVSLSKMSTEEKFAWYRKQKAQRLENGASRKRTFETAVGALTEERKRMETQQDVDRWFRFKDWAAREALLTGAKPEELPRLWKAETSKPGAITKVVRGELLLKEWSGCEDRLGSQHELSTSVKQRMDLASREDLERFHEISCGRLERGQNLLSADRLVNSANNTRQESQLLNVVADMEEAAQTRRELEARLFEEAEIAEARRKAAQEEKPKVSSATLEKLQYEQSMVQADTTIESWLRKRRNSYAGVVADIKEAGIESDAAGKAELQIKTQDFERLVSELKREVMEKLQTLGSLQIFLKIKEDGEADGPTDLDELARHWNALYIRVSKAVKEVSTCQPAADLKKFLGGFRSWVNQFKKKVGNSKKTKKDSSKDENKKAKVSGPPAGTGTKMGEEILSSYAGALNAGQEVSENFNLANECFNALDWLCQGKGSQCLHITAAQTKAFVDDICGLTYFAQQKEWVYESWSKDKAKAQVSLALVAKSNIATKILKGWAHVLGKKAEDELISVSTDVDPLLGEIFIPCFWSFGKKTHKIFYSTDYGLTEFKVILEGACLFIGRPVPDDGLKSFGSFCQTVSENESQNWLDECNDHGWAVLLKKGDMLGIPAGHAYIQVCVEESHGVRILKGSRRGLKASKEILQARIQQWPELQEHRTGKLLAWANSV
ncbi:unnamed protein product [Symbiodinium sp. CCMP2592]|nr:unnamed protein product [Symbiodinium sp. CCMP2592]